MRFRPTLASTLVLAALAIAFAGLGRWQLERAAIKAERIRAHTVAPRLDALPAPETAAEFTRLTLSGHFDPERHVLLDNQVLAGQAGVHVLTPFQPDGAATLLLVNRGWLPLPRDRSRLPDVPTPADRMRIHGTLDTLRQAGVRLGEAGPEAAGPWPRLVTWAGHERLEEALESPVYTRVLYLDADSPAGFDGRDWRPVVTGPDRHRAYAVQWFALAGTAVVAWLVLALRSARK